MKGGGRKERIKDGILSKSQPYVAGFKGGGRGHKPKNVGGLYKLEKARNGFLPYNLQKKMQTCHTLSLAQ